MMDEGWINHVSFSGLVTLQQCPYQYYLQKIIGIEPVPNAFAQAGALAHELLAMWAKGEATPHDIMLLWIERYGKTVTAPFPKYLASKDYSAKMFDSILRYFEHFSGFPGYEVIGAEKKFESMISGMPFIGVVDLILRDRETGRLMIIDHKSCSLSSFRKNRDQMYRQVLLYAKSCADEYGQFPEFLGFNLIKEGILDKRKYEPEDYMAAKIWAEMMIQDFQTRDIVDWFETRPEFFFCTNLCDCRNQCCFGRSENHKRKEEENAQKSAAVIT